MVNIQPSSVIAALSMAVFDLDPTDFENELFVKIHAHGGTASAIVLNCEYDAGMTRVDCAPETIQEVVEGHYDTLMVIAHKMISAGLVVEGPHLNHH